ncbi:uncharacterized protein LOC116299094 [Actinia tenebrosa]|uniref:Uncharacterized protein LOC116299094 n=1 Tax=Actinia tenebrosa TaxID=6105 RepID=A0A6P8IDM2_ACTTE|nr:uncharacterized protein LOC116299094 [Actinia tenebrosa]
MRFEVLVVLALMFAIFSDGCRIPSEPTNLAAHDIQSRTLTISWRRPKHACNSTQLNYTVYYKVQGERVLQEVEVVSVTKVKLFVKPYRKYEIFVMARNREGFGPPSVKTYALTLQEVEQEGGSCVSDWVKMSQHVVCFEAKGNSFGSFHNNVRSGLVVAIKLEHVYGHVSCAGTSHNSHWGCGNLNGKYGINSLNVVVTDQLNRIIFPKEQYIGLPPRIWYGMPFMDTASSKELIFTDFAQPFYFPEGKQMRIWYGEDLKDSSESDNVGRACVNVYAKFIA